MANAQPENVVNAPAAPITRNSRRSPVKAPMLNPAKSEPSELIKSKVASGDRTRPTVCSMSARKGAPMNAPKAIANTAVTA